MKAKVKDRALCFASQDAIECVIRFRIDNHTIKREALKLNGYLVPLGVILFCIFISLSDMVRCKLKVFQNG